METIYGVYIKNIFRNEKTGVTRFVIRETVNNKMSYRTCEAVLAQYPTRIPLMLEGKEIINKDEKQDTPVFYADTVKAASISEEYTQNFLSSDAFRYIGNQTACKIVQVTGADIFSFAKREDAVEQLSVIKGFS